MLEDLGDPSVVVLRGGLLLWLKLVLVRFITVLGHMVKPLNWTLTQTHAIVRRLMVLQVPIRQFADICCMLTPPFDPIWVYCKYSIYQFC